MIVARLFTLLGLLAYVSVSNAFAIRDVNGKWRFPSWEKRSEPGEIIQIPLKSNDDEAYSATVGIGSPYQEIEMAFSLSQNHMVFATPKGNNQPGFYNPSASSSYKKTTYCTTFKDLEGNTVDVTFAGESCQIMDFSYNASVAITTPDIGRSVFPPGTYGVLGYGVDGATELPKDSALLNSYIPAGAPAAECGIEVNRVEDGVGGGLFTMGGNDSSAFTGTVTPVTVPPSSSVTRPSWSIPMDNVFSSTHAEAEGLVPSGGLASIDLYYPSISLPSTAVANIYAGISGAARSTTHPNRYNVPCNAQIQLTFMFAGRNFSIDPRDAIARDPQGNGTCFGTVVIANDNVLKFGSPLMRNVYTIFGGVFTDPNRPVFTVAFADKVRRTSPPSYTSGTAAPLTSPTASPGPTSAAAHANSLSFTSLALFGIASVFTFLVA